ncbi:MFS general substrate transporter [Peniophora sp. CONT]|nr:MFS general substrate transporter [Peniophora sp. CONT]
MTRNSTDSATVAEGGILESRPSFEGFRVRSPDEPRPLDDQGDNDEFYLEPPVAHPHAHDVEKDEAQDAASFSSKEKQAHADVLYVDFEDGDVKNPIHFSYLRKWTITFVACYFTCLSAATASSYSSGMPSMIADLNCSEILATLGLSVYPLGFGVIPLFSAPFSEELGRWPLYAGSAFGFMLMHVMVARADNIATVILGRFLGGAFGSTGSTMVSGTIADIWLPAEYEVVLPYIYKLWRGLPMAMFSLTAIAGTGMGPVAAGWIEANPHLQWRWIQYIHIIAAGLCFIFVLFFMKETRAPVILTRRAKKLRKETGDERYRARAEEELPSLRTLLYISCTRPLLLLFTEPVVTSFSCWIGFAWGVLYCIIESVAPAFRTVHHFGTGEVGTVFLALVVGSFLGVASNVHQERLYRKHFPKHGPEARLYWAMGAGVLFPVGVFIYAWTAFENVHWIGMVIGLTLFMWATFMIYLGSFTYLADCYGPYASSANAGQSLFRNIMGFAFPLFTTQMFNTLGYHWGNTLFACIAVLMIPVPFILYRFGPLIRSKSTFSQKAMEAQANHR